MEISRLKEVDIRSLWRHEQHDFSEWLSQEKNINILDDALGLTLTDISKEVFVGTYRCDLVATDESTGIKVIIENQLEASDHDHLGKIITYASGLDAQVVVWIVANAREEHKSAIEWLNNNTNSDINFFLIELHAYKIDDSLPAPYFEVVQKPNDFRKNIKVNGDKSELRKSQVERLEFWNRFNDALIERGKPFSVRKATTNAWYDVGVGSSAAHVAITLVNKESYVSVEFYIINDKEMFDKLIARKNEIEGELGFKLDWQRLENRNASRIIYYIKGLNFDNKSNYDKLIDESITKAVMMRDVFKKYIQN